MGGLLVLVLVVLVVGVVVFVVASAVAGANKTEDAIDEGDPALQQDKRPRRGFFG